MKTSAMLYDEAEVVFKDSTIVDADVVVDQNIITARGGAWIELTIEICGN